MTVEPDDGRSTGDPAGDGVPAGARITGRAMVARRVVLVLFWTNIVWAVGLPFHLTSHPTALTAVLLAVGLGLAGLMLAAVMWAAVTPWVPAPTSYLLVGITLLAVLALWWPLTDLREPDQEPWSWLAGVVAGAVWLTVPWRAGVALGILLSGIATATALIVDASVLSHLLPLLGSGGLVLLMMQAMVWLLRLLLTSEDARRTEARLVVTEERLRVAREIHDAVGHRMTLIALKAELTRDLAGTDPVRTRAEAESIRDLTAATLADVRRALHGDTVTDLGTQLDTARVVLESAGVAARIADPPYRLDDQKSRLLAAVVREAVTNVLRHANATQVTLTFDGSGTEPEMMITNDGAGGQRPVDHADDTAGGAGLLGLAARCAEFGGRLTAARAPDGHFTLRVQLPAGAG